MGSPDSRTCLNCGAAMTGHYCARCGQPTPHTDVTLREFLHETTHELTHLDGRIPQTLKTLFLEPGVLTRDFLAGRRARWLSPLRIYLVCSLAFFLSGPLMERITHRSTREFARVKITNPDGSQGLTPEARQKIAEGLPGRIFGVDRLERAAANSPQLNRTISSIYPNAMFVLLPLFALFTSLVWRGPGRRYPAHLYVALHLHAAWFGALALATIVTLSVVSDTFAVVVALVTFGYIAWYTLTALRRVFADSWITTIAKTAVVGIVYSLCLLVASLTLLAYVLMTM